MRRSKTLENLSNENSFDEGDEYNTNKYTSTRNNNNQKTPQQISNKNNTSLNEVFPMDLPNELHANGEISKLKKEKMKDFFVNSWLVQKENTEVILKNFDSSHVHISKLDLSEILEESQGSKFSESLLQFHKFYIIIQYKITSNIQSGLFIIY